MSIKVSIITVTYNSEKTLSRAIESVLNQTYKNIEYIIVDGLSKDNTVKIASSYEDAFELKNIAYKIISEKDNGMYDALNKGTEIATGEIIGAVNSDDYYEPIAIETIVKKYEEDKYDMIYGDLRIIKSSGNFIKKAKLKKFATSRYWNHPTTFITKEVYNKEKYKLESMYDDYELMLRLRKNDYKITVVNEVLSNFVFGGMSNTKKFKDVKLRLRIKFQIFKNFNCSLLYYLDTLGIELGKFILG